MTDLDVLGGRGELLGGPPGKRAEALVFLIQNRTAHLAGRSRNELRRYNLEASAGDDALSFFSAFAHDGEPAEPPTVQQLERFAPRWADLVPRNPRLQAAVAHALAQRYTFTHGAVPCLRAALGLDDPAVRRSFERLYDQPLETIYAERVPPAQRLRWAWTALARRLDDLPPFWTAYALTLTETVGATILALPIAFAEVGPIGGLVVLVVLGLVNVLTLAYMCEAIARSGPMRYRGAYLGRLLADLLAPSASAVVSLVMLGLCLLLLPTYYIGVASTLAAATPIPAAVWAAGMFAVNLFFLRRGLGATVAGALVVGAVNIGIILALTAVTLPHLRGDLLQGGDIPFVGGVGFDPEILGLVFGVALSAFFGHTSAALSGQIVLPRDPSGRALLRGAVAATLTAIALYGLFVVSVNGAVAPGVLTSESGTVLSPLADTAGPAVLALGSVFVILALGMGSVHFSIALFSVVRERLPAEVAPTLVLPARRGRLALRPRGLRPSSLSIGVTYLGLRDGTPLVRVEIETDTAVRREDVALSNRWQLSSSDAVWPEGTNPRAREAAALVLEPLDVHADELRVRVTTTLRLTYHGDPPGGGVGVAQLLADDNAALLAWLLRTERADTATVADHLGIAPQQAADVLARLVADGKLTEDIVGGVVHYVPAIARPHRRAPAALWDAIVDEPQSAASQMPPTAPAAAPQRRARVGPRAHFLLAASPVVAAFGVTEWMILTGSASFAGMLGFIGVIAVPLLSGVLPVLLVAASRRRGLPASSSPVRTYAATSVLVVVYVVFVGSVALHGLIWQSAAQRAGAIVAAGLMVVFTMVLLRSGSLRRRLTVEVRGDARTGGRTQYRVTLAGEPVPATLVVDDGQGEQPRTGAEGTLPDVEDIRRLSVTIPGDAPLDADEVKVWLHRIGLDGESMGLAGIADVGAGRRRLRGRLRVLTGEYLARVEGPAGEVTVTIERPESAP